MKKLLITALSLAVLAFSSSAQETKVKKEDDKVKAKQTSANDKDMKVKIKGEGMGQDMVYPYQATYSSQFAPGSPAHAKLILDMWKAWDDNAFDRIETYLADTVRQELSSGMVVTGKENMLKMGKDYRDKFTTVKSTVEAWMPTRSIDRGQDFVLIWGTEEDTDKDGKVTTTRFHEVWGINKDGKIDYMRQYSSQVPKEQ
jgi:hypothetical protein